MIGGIDLLFDVLLCAALVWLAWRTITTPAVFDSVVLFMVLGLLMALAWARLDAPDVALAEAVLGAGINGALLLGACKAMLTDPGGARDAERPAPGVVPGPLAAALCVPAGVILAWLMMAAPGGHGAVREGAAAAAAGHFLQNPVSMVLLDLRAYDTLMESVVLLLAWVGASALFTRSGLASPFSPRADHRLHTEPLVRIVTPFLLLVAFYLWWAGAHAPGGAFQAGSLLAALGIVYQLTGRLQPAEEAGTVLRTVLVIGPLVFALFAWLGLAWSDAVLAYPESGGYSLVLVMELALILSIAASLVLLFAARPGMRPGDRN